MLTVFRALDEKKGSGAVKKSSGTSSGLSRLLQLGQKRHFFFFLQDSSSAAFGLKPQIETWLYISYLTYLVSAAERNPLRVFPRWNRLRLALG